MDVGVEGYIQVFERFDLHAHSRYSDGANDREEIQKLLSDHNSIWTVSDHDNLEFHRKKNKASFTATEIATYVDIVDERGNVDTYSIELLVYGYNVTKFHWLLKKYLESTKDIQSVQLEMLKEKLYGIGCKFNAHLKIDEIQFAHATVFRELIKYKENSKLLKGMLESEDVFYRAAQRSDSIIYIDMRNIVISPERLSRYAKESDGLVSIAHPYRNWEVAEKSVIALGNCIDAVECLHPSAKNIETARSMLNLCRRIGKLASGGTDYHFGQYLGTPFFELVDEYEDRFDWIRKLAHK